VRSCTALCCWVLVLVVDSARAQSSAAATLAALVGSASLH
jgi:hypothetical protein